MKPGLQMPRCDYWRPFVCKLPLAQKIFGEFELRVLMPEERLFRGFDDVFMAPHSRHTETRCFDVQTAALQQDLHILSESRLECT